jgi:hypothetical protein
VASEVMINNQKLYVNREEGFAGFGLKKDEFVSECSDLDEIMVFRGDGTMIVTKVDEKKYIGKNVEHIAVYRKTEPQPVYNMIYQDGRGGSCMLKRFTVAGTTRDKEYILTRGKEGSKILWFSLSQEKDAESVRVNFRPKPKMKVFHQDVNFNDFEVKGRDTKGVTVSKNLVSKIIKLSGPVKSQPQQLEIKAKENPKKVADKPAAKSNKPEAKSQKTAKGKKSKAKVQKPAAVIKKPQKKIALVKEEKPVTMEWDFKSDTKIRSERAKVLLEQEKKSTGKNDQLKMNL